MYSGWKEKFARKKAKNKAYADSWQWRTNELLLACLESLRGSCTFTSAQMQEAVITAVNIAIREDIWVTAELLSGISEDLLPDMVYIVWDEANLPVLYAPWSVVKEDLSAVLRVNSDTFLVTETMDRIVWFDRDGQIRLYSIAGGEL